MWNDMPNQKVVFEIYSHIAPKYVSSTILDFKWNLTIFLHNEQSVSKPIRTTWLHSDVNK